MQFIRRSLGAKVLLLTSLLTILAFTLLFLGNSYWQRQTVLEQIEIGAKEFSQLLEMSVEKPMAIGDNQGTVAQFDEVAARHEAVKVYLTNWSGNITYATHKNALRKDLTALHPDERLKTMLAATLKENGEQGAQMELDGSAYFVEAKSIPNQPSCHHCHGASKPILGSLVTLKNVDHQMASLRASQFKSAGISLAGLVVLLASLLLFMKRTVVNRIRRIADYTEDVAKGELNVCLDVDGSDELAELCTYLSNMVSTIKDQLEYNKGVLNGIIIPLFVADQEERLQFANQPLLNILGRESEQTLGRKVSEIFRGGAGEKTSTGKVLATGQSMSGMLHFSRGDGVTFPLHYEISPLRDASGKTVGAIGVLIDLTQEEKDKARIEAHRTSLMAVATEVTEVALKLEGTAQTLSSRMEELTRGVDSTADRTSQVAAAMEEMNATVLEVAKNAAETSQASEEANKVAAAGGEEVARSVTISREVAATTANLSVTLNNLADKAVDIGRVLGVINDIADQTNLLALNAAIEAARAGDAGRGFAVVADEVRKLAEKTVQATKEVAQVIGAIQDGAREAVSEMGATRERVEQSTVMAEHSGEVLSRIVAQSDKIADMVRSIAAASEQQSSTSEEINLNVSGVNEVSQHISTQIQDANGQIREVARMAVDLSRLVARFKAE